MKKCSIPGCKNQKYAKDLCLSHYNSIRNEARKMLECESREPRFCKICGKDITRDHLMAKYCKEHRFIVKHWKNRGFDENEIKKMFEGFERIKKSKEDILNRIKVRHGLLPKDDDTFEVKLKDANNSEKTPRSPLTRKYNIRIAERNQKTICKNCGASVYENELEKHTVACEMLKDIRNMG